MRRLFLHLFASCAMFCLGVGLTTVVKFLSRNESPAPPKVEQRPNTIEIIGVDEQELRKIFREYGPAQTKHDRAFFERVEADNFVLFLGDQNLTREQDIQLMESWPKDIVYDCEVENIKFMNDTAVVTGRMHVRYPSGSSDSWGFIDICIRDGDSWKILSTTSSD